MSQINAGSIWDVSTSDKVSIDSLKNAQGEQKHFARGEVVIKEGGAADAMYFVLEGMLHVIKNYRTMDERYVASLHAGDLFGEMALFLKESRTATIVAIEDTTVLEIRREAVVEFMKDNPETTYAIVELLCTRLKNVLDTLADY